MKLINVIIPCCILVTALTSCEHSVSFETTVHEDGQLDRVITLQQENDTTNRFFQVDDWERSITKRPRANEKTVDVVITLKKTFPNAEASNAQLAKATDTTFAVTSSFEKKFRWFYTYMYYSETYRALNRMAYPPDDYLAPEDYSFIDRLPAEGKKISKADSVYLAQLNSKLSDIYGTRAIFEAYWDIGIETLKENQVAAEWYDTLARHKEQAFDLTKDNDQKEIDDNFFMLDLMKRLNVPLQYDTVREQYARKMEALERTLTFIGVAGDGKYHHRINMPWPVVRTNADSVAGNALFWSPPPIKFLVKDYTLYAESRKLNGWAVVLSAAVIVFTVYLLVRKRRS